MKFGIRASFNFPLQTSIGRKEILIGGTWLLVPIYGWILNLGHRVIYTNKVLNGKNPFPSWINHGQLLRHGLITLLGMILYHLPGFMVYVIGDLYELGILKVIGVILGLVGIMLIPGFMTNYCVEFDKSVIFNPVNAIKTINQCGWYYMRAWGIAILALIISFIGLLGAIIGFLYTSVYFWQIAAYSFSSACVNSGTIKIKSAQQDDAPEPRA